MPIYGPVKEQPYPEPNYPDLIFYISYFICRGAVKIKKLP